MGDVLDQASALLRCKECSWYKSCVLPLRLTAEDIKRQLESTMPGAGVAGPASYGMSEVLANLAAAVQSSILEGCPVFIDRLRSSPKLAEQLKKMMQAWGREEDT